MDSCFILDKCCFCIDLRVACFIIAYLELVATVIATLVLIITMAAGGVIIATAHQMIEHSYTKLDTLQSAGVGVAGGLMVALTGILLFFILMALAFVITFVVGLHQRKRGHIIAYFVYAVIFQFIEFIIYVTICSTQPVDALFVLSNLVAILLHVYFLVVVRSYYVTMNYSKGSAIYKA